MTDSKPRRAKGTVDYDLKGMGDVLFEAMVARLIRLEFRQAFKPANTSDGGADMVLPASGSEYERCWQAKHFPGPIRWRQCEKSLKAALKSWPGISEYTFVFPRDLTVGEQKTFDKKFRAADAEIEVNHWNGTEIQARLTGSDDGQRVAKTFFDEEADREHLERLIAAGAPLDTHEDALERLGNVGRFLASSDAYFSYPAVTHEAGQPGPSPTPGSIMSLGESDSVIARRIDVVPRDEEAVERYGPQFMLDASEGEAGKRAAAQLEEALREGKEVDIGEGIDVTFSRMPPGLKDLEGTRLSGGRVVLGKPERVRPRVEPFRARLEADTDRDKAGIDIELRQLNEVPEGWDDGFTGTFGPLTVTERVRWRGGRGEVRWDFHYRRDDSPVRDQLAALRLIHAAGGAGEFAFWRQANPDAVLRSQSQPQPVDPTIKALIAFFEDVLEIEGWADIQYELPAAIKARDVDGIRRMAAIIRAGGVSVSWNQLEVVVTEPGLEPLRAGGVMRIERPAMFRALGREVPIGFTAVDVVGWEVESVDPSDDDPSQYVVRLKPRDEEAAQAFEALRKGPTRAKSLPKDETARDEPTAAKRPPPPPPRKRGKRTRQGRRRKRRR